MTTGRDSESRPRTLNLPRVLDLQLFAAALEEILIDISSSDASGETMDTESVSIDISSIKQKALAPIDVSLDSAAHRPMHANCAIRSRNKESSTTFRTLNV